MLSLSFKKEEQWREGGCKLAALILMKNSHFYRTLVSILHIVHPTIVKSFK